MSKMKHLLRKLYIGDHQQHGRPLPPALDPSPPPQTTSSQPSNTSSSPSSDLPQPGWSSENENWNNNFNFLEEEFQMQLALAISVSDPVQNRVDSETAQIDAAKQISLGCSVSQSLPDFLSFRYWSSNVVNYDEKVMDGFYDVCGIDSNLAIQPNMPSLVDLGEISVTDDIGREVIIIDRAVDVELRKLEERVYFLSMEYRALGKGVNTTPLVQKIADLIVERMGGPVSDVEEMFWRWRARNHELRIYLNTIIHPLGSLDVGHSRQRALLFKVLADKINLPCKLVKGSYYTGTDEGAVNLIKLDDGSEYIIDLMGAPGTLIPAELPSYHQQSFGLDPWSIGTFAGFDRSSSISEHGVRIRSIPSFDGKTNTRNSGSESSSTPIKPNGKDRKIAHNILTEQLIHDTTTVKGPELSREHSIMLSTMEDLLPDISSHYLREDKFLEKDRFLHRESVFDQNHPEISSSKDERSLVTFTALQLNNFTCSSNPKKSAEGLGAPQFKMEAAGYNSSLSPSNQQNVHFEHKIDEAVISNEDGAVGRELVYCGNRETMEIGCSNQLIGNNNDDRVQIEPVVNGVAEILWEDLWIGERVGIGSYGEVYRAEWNGTEVAVKKFMKQDISGDALAQFKCEIEIMLMLRHPNVVLLMGAVTQPPNMSILTEFLPRGSLYKLLHRTDIQINEDRRIKMALDVAKGMNYLHTSHPIIVHRDLKSPNLLVDRNWVVKVCDFGMSRLQHHTFLSSKSAAGTAEWMAPEVLRSEISNEKSDVYSFGVILWELATLRVPWTEMNSMQVVGAVGFQGRHLDIPPMVDPLVAGIISDCWNRSPQARPSFAQIIGRLKNLQRLSVRGIKGRKSTLMM